MPNVAAAGGRPAENGATPGSESLYLSALGWRNASFAQLAGGASAFTAGGRFTTRNRCSHRGDRYYSDYSIRPIRRGRRAAAAPRPATPPPPRPVARGSASAGFFATASTRPVCDLYYGLKEDYQRRRRGRRAVAERPREVSCIM